MSSSSLWGLDKEYRGAELEEFSNSWYFSPIAWDMLFQKYLPERTVSQFGTKGTYMTAAMFDNTIEHDLNQKINNSEVSEDRIVWEFAMQQVFFTKDKEVVSDAIKRFMDINKEFAEECGDHIFERFNEVAEAISNLDESEYPNFVFKNTSVDDNVEFWFRKYNEEEEEYDEVSLREMDKTVTEFVYIEDGKITGWKNNVKFFSEKP